METFFYIPMRSQAYVSSSIVFSFFVLELKLEQNGTIVFGLGTEFTILMSCMVSKTL